VARTPLRFDVALRFCRQFIISEEWLATGKHDLFHEAMLAKKIGNKAAGEIWPEFDKVISIRQSLDLLSEPAAIHIKPGCLFSVAFDQIFKNRYREIAFQHDLLPRIILSDADKPEIAINLLKAINERFIALLINDANARQKASASYWREYTMRVFEVSDLAYRTVRNSPLTPKFIEQFDWLRKIFSIASAPSSASFPTIPSRQPGENKLTQDAFKSTTDFVKPVLPKLIQRLQRATEAHGSKSELAAWLGVPRQSVTDWLSGRKEPGGETTLRLLHWVEQQERQK